MENPIKMDDLRVPYFRKPPYFTQFLALEVGPRCVQVSCEVSHKTTSTQPAISREDTWSRPFSSMSWLWLGLKHGKTMVKTLWSIMKPWKNHEKNNHQNHHFSKIFRKFLELSLGFSRRARRLQDAEELEQIAQEVVDYKEKPAAKSIHFGMVGWVSNFKMVGWQKRMWLKWKRIAKMLV